MADVLRVGRKDVDGGPLPAMTWRLWRREAAQHVPECAHARIVQANGAFAENARAADLRLHVAHAIQRRFDGRGGGAQNLPRVALSLGSSCRGVQRIQYRLVPE